MDIRETKYIDLFGQIPLSELLVYDIPRTDLAVTGKDGKVDIPTVKEFKKAFDRLADNALIYGSPDDEEDWLRINIIGSVKWDKKADCMHIKQHEDIVKELPRSPSTRFPSISGVASGKRREHSNCQ